jgi:hypothetical protein
MTVIESLAAVDGNTAVEVWSTQAGHGLVRIALIVEGRQVIAFGSLLSIDARKQATLYEHEDAPGRTVRCKAVRELGPIEV